MYRLLIYGHKRIFQIKIISHMGRQCIVLDRQDIETQVKKFHYTYHLRVL